MFIKMIVLHKTGDGVKHFLWCVGSFHLLILDDFGMERGTEYGLEQVYNVIDSRYRS